MHRSTVSAMFSYYKKPPETVNPQWKKIYCGSAFQRVQCKISWPCPANLCSTTWHRRAWGGTSCSPCGTGKQKRARERRSWGPCPKRPHPNDSGPPQAPPPRSSTGWDPCSTCDTHTLAICPPSQGEVIFLITALKPFFLKCSTYKTHS